MSLTVRHSDTENRVGIVVLAEESNDRKRRATFDWYWFAYCGAACFGVLVPLVLLFTDVCFYLECSEETRSFAVPVIFVGVAVTVLVAGWVLRSDRRNSNRLAGVVIAVVGVLASSCTGYGVVNFAVPGERASLVREAAETRTMLDRLPGVHQVTTHSGNTFSAVVVLTADASAEQVAQVVRSFREQVAEGPDFREWEVDIEVRRPDSDSSFKSGHKGFGDAPEHAARWLELSRAFPADQVRWTTQTWTFYFASPRRRPARRDHQPLHLADPDPQREPAAIAGSSRDLLRASNSSTPRGQI
ncbi:hypothetical protein NBRGN_044_00280 [Nocardia brasiliensis NBRC 14402]|nr:hypothetical protein NBRGN_044_00280 [Nocardia brasiliensis NBRC 14402]